MTEHGTLSRANQSRHGSGGPGEQHLPLWAEGLHNLQRTLENVYVSYEMGPSLQHGASGAHGAHGTATAARALGGSAQISSASQTARALNAPTAFPMAELVENIRHAGVIPAANQAAAATPATQAAQVLQTSSTPQMAELVENIRHAGTIPEASPAAAAAPATQAAPVLRTPGTSEMNEMVDNIFRTQAADRAAFSASRTVPAATQATTATEAAAVAEVAPGSRAATALGQGTKGVSSFARFLGGLGILGGGVEMFEGGQELFHRQRQQGMLDLVAGLSGIGAGALTLLGTASLPISLGAAGLGAMAYGNKYTKEEAWWGHNGHGDNRSALDWAGASTAAAYQGTRQALGGGVLGTLGGGLLAGLTAVNTGSLAVLGNVIGGVVGAVRGAGHLASRLWQR